MARDLLGRGLDVVHYALLLRRDDLRDEESDHLVLFLSPLFFFPVYHFSRFVLFISFLPLCFFYSSTLLLFFLFTSLLSLPFDSSSLPLLYVSSLRSSLPLTSTTFFIVRTVLSVSSRFMLIESNFGRRVFTEL